MMMRDDEIYKKCKNYFVFLKNRSTLLKRLGKLLKRLNRPETSYRDDRKTV
jgi:hypothetical protein